MPELARGMGRGICEGQTSCLILDHDSTPHQSPPGDDANEPVPRRTIPLALLAPRPIASPLSRPLSIIRPTYIYALSRFSLLHSPSLLLPPLLSFAAELPGPDFLYAFPPLSLIRSSSPSPQWQVSIPLSVNRLSSKLASRRLSHRLYISHEVRSLFRRSLRSPPGPRSGHPSRAYSGSATFYQPPRLWLTRIA